ncbi:MAG: 2-dehydro-3-deoxy-6-phosphogalactonate aldolase [Burkholderiaceae bacterium]
MTSIESFRLHCADLPLIAILRGIAPAEAAAVGEALAGAGFRLLEVPLNSPQPLQSIAKLVSLYPQALVGAGTVLTPGQVCEVHAAGGRLIVAPTFHPRVVQQAVRLQMVCLPGIATPTEAFGALDAGAHGLKLFPAEAASPAALKALLAVLPTGTPVFPVGGITAQNMAVWRGAGASGFGIGSALYKPGKSAGQIATDAAEFAAAWRGYLRA